MEEVGCLIVDFSHYVAKIEEVRNAKGNFPTAERATKEGTTRGVF